MCGLSRSLRVPPLHHRDHITSAGHFPAADRGPTTPVDLDFAPPREIRPRASPTRVTSRTRKKPSRASKPPVFACCNHLSVWVDQTAKYLDLPRHGAAAPRQPSSQGTGGTARIRAWPARDASVCGGSRFSILKRKGQASKPIQRRRSRQLGRSQQRAPLLSAWHSVCCSFHRTRLIHAGVQQSRARRDLPTPCPWRDIVSNQREKRRPQASISSFATGCTTRQLVPEENKPLLSAFFLGPPL